MRCLKNSLYLEMRVDVLLQVNTLKYYSEWTNVETLRKRQAYLFLLVVDLIQ